MKLIRSFLFHGNCGINSHLCRESVICGGIQLVSTGPRDNEYVPIRLASGSNCPTHIYRVKEINIGIHDHYMLDLLTAPHCRKNSIFGLSRVFLVDLDH